MNKKQVQNKEDIEEYYSTNRKFKFKNDYTPENIQDVIDRMLSESPETTYLKGGYHCEKDRRRSVDDIITISKYYFPDASVKEILNEFSKIIQKKNTKGYYNIVSYCGVIKKNNFYQGAYYHNPNLDNFKAISFKKNGFSNCEVKIQDLI